MERETVGGFMLGGWKHVILLRDSKALRRLSGAVQCTVGVCPITEGTFQVSRCGLCEIRE